MGKIKERCIEVMELIEDGMAPWLVALFLGMSVDEVIEIVEFMGADYPNEFGYYEQN